MTPKRATPQSDALTQFHQDSGKALLLVTALGALCLLGLGRHTQVLPYGLGSLLAWLWLGQLHRQTLLVASDTSNVSSAGVSRVKVIWSGVFSVLRPALVTLLLYGIARLVPEGLVVALLGFLSYKGAWVVVALYRGFLSRNQSAS
jgi:hypothetical protein